MKKLLLLCMVFCLSIVDGLAQNYDETNLEALTNDFIQKTNSSDALSLMTTIKSYYEALSSDSKSKMRSYYMDKITSLLEKEQKDKALPVINLYQNIVDVNDEKLPSLLYIKGNIYAEKMDSIKLGQTIIELNNNAFKQNNAISDYISNLNSKMNKIRKYVPPYKKIDGIWVADNLFWDKGKKNQINSSYPNGGTDIFMQINYNTKMDTISFCITNKSEVAFQMDVDMGRTVSIKKIRDYYSQLIIPYATDSIYVLWSSEKINRNSPEVASILRGTVSGTTAAVNAELAQNNKHSFSSQLLGGVATTVTEVGLNAVISALFTPTKRMFVLEARLKIENNLLITGSLTYKYKWIAADGDVYEDKMLLSRVSLARWMPDCDIAFTSYWLKPILHPLNNIDPKIYEKREGTRYTYCHNVIGKGKMFPAKSSSAYNIDQYKWLMLYNDSILKSHGYHGKFAVNDDIRPYIGVQYSSLDTKMQKKTKLTEGVYIYEVDETSAAYVGGLKKGDVILSVNDQKMKDKNDMDMLIYNMKLGDWLKMKVLRGKKQLELLVRVTWK